MVRMSRLLICIVVVLCPVASLSAAVPWEVWEDAVSDSLCGVVNTADFELVVMVDNQTLTLVTGQDVELTGAVVDANGDVTVNGQPAGYLSFALDGDGYRTLWWLSEENTVMGIDGVTLTVESTDSVPADFENVPCDACDFWDKTLQPSIITQPQSQDVCTGDRVVLSVVADECQLAGYQWYKAGVPISGATNSSYVIDSADAFDTASYYVLIRNDAGDEVASRFVNIVVEECTTQPTASFCGNGLAMVSVMMFSSLMLMKLARRRA